MKSVVCEECRAQGLKSTVSVGGGATTAMGWVPYYDEDGVYHNHDPNWHGQSLRCSNGHEWHERWLTRCPAGDYPAINREGETEA